MSNVLRTFPILPNHLHDVSEGKNVSSLAAWQNSTLTLSEEGTHFGYVLEGRCELSCSSGDYHLNPGIYFSIPGAGFVGGEGRGVIFTRHHHHGFFQIGGPIENRGRLRYINGCSDSLLVSPIKKGDPCLNLLHVPDEVDQTPHTHPSHRLGVIVRGTGICRTSQGDVSLIPGLTWCIEANGLHSFHTTTSELLIVAYHPDSDFGPTDEQHPMINRTLIKGVPASELSASNAANSENRHEMS